MITFEQARSGSPVAVFNSTHLNSRFNPDQEAQRFINESLGNKTPRLVVIFGETLGYIAKCVEASHPGCKCVQVFFDTVLFDQSVKRTDHAWHPKSRTPLSAFFLSAIGELEMQAIDIVEWEPSAKAFPAAAVHARDELRKALEIHHGSIGTTASFGRRWIRNIVGNFLGIEDFAPLHVRNGPLVIAATGPNLEKSFEVLRAERSRYSLWALPSSLHALEDNGLVPELVVLTDPGYYTLLHLPPLRRLNVPVAMPLSAARGIWRYASPVHLLNQGSWLECTIMAAAKIPHTFVPPNGTVAGTALQLAAQRSGPVIFAGLDFTNRDIKTHAWPHAFEPFIDRGVTRISPRFTRRYLRANESQIMSGTKVNPLATYAAWFSTVATKFSLPIFRLNPSEVAVPGIRGIEDIEFGEVCERSPPGDIAGTDPAISRPLDPETRYHRASLVHRLLGELSILLATMAERTPPKPDSFLGRGPESMIYYLATPEVLRFAHSEQREDFQAACATSIAWIEELIGMTERWR